MEEYARISLERYEKFKENEKEIERLKETTISISTFFKQYITFLMESSSIEMAHHQFNKYCASLDVRVEMKHHSTVITFGEVNALKILKL